jgi:hypothetical protein
LSETNLAQPLAILRIYRAQLWPPVTCRTVCHYLLWQPSSWSIRSWVVDGRQNTVSVWKSVRWQLDNSKFHMQTKIRKMVHSTTTDQPKKCLLEVDTTKELV